MRIAEFCIKHRVTTIMLYVLVVVFGVYCFSSLPMALMPNIEMPMAVVYATYVAGPEEVENLVTRVLESGCASVAGVDEIQSVSSENVSMVMITFADNTDMDEALVSLREKIDQVKSALPDDASSPTVMSIDVDSMPVIEIGLSGTDLAQLQTFAEDTIGPAFERIEGVASVDIMGGYSQEIAINTYSDRLLGYNITTSYIAQILAAENIALPGGDVQSGQQTITARTDGEFTSIDDIKNTLIPLPTGGTVRLEELASVKLQPADKDAIVKIGGDEAILISVNKQSGVNTLEVAERVSNSMNNLVKENPSLSPFILSDQSDQINASVDNVIENILTGIVLAAIIIFIFLRKFGATLAISLSMPICILSVFLMMRVMGITLNVMSLSGLALGVGMIVDNSIVVLENIFTYRAEGKSRMEACVGGTAEVSLSIIAGTMTTVAVFIPMGLTSGIVGMMFKEFSLTIAALLLSSLVISLTLVPLLCYILLDRSDKKRPLNVRHEDDLAQKPMMRIYRSILKFFISHRLFSMSVSVGFIVVCIMALGNTGVELIPTMDQSMISVSISMPAGSEVTDKGAIADRIVNIAVDTIPELESVYYSTGSSTSVMSSASGSSVTINLIGKGERDRSAEKIAKQLRRDLQSIAGAELTVDSTGGMDMSALSGDAISVQLSGDDYDVLTQAGDKLVAEIQNLPDAVDVKNSASEQVTQINISINRENASRFGLTAATIGQAVRGNLTGTTATTLKLSGDEIDVMVKGDTRISQSIDELKTVGIPVATGGTVPLELVATVTTELAPQSINRLNQSRTITISGSTESGDSTQIVTDVEEIMQTFELPDGVTYEQSGEMDSIMESFSSLGLALLVSLALIYFVLASQFESFVLPIIVMMILPTSLIGSLVILPITGNKLSVVAILGVIILAGTVVNSAIVLIDYIIQRRANGESKNEAILNACPRRVRPVLMTTLTTILGLVPMAMSSGESSEMMQPMAFVMIAGMVISIIVTLLFTPVYYSVIDSFVALVTRRDKKKKEIPETTE